MLSVLCTLLALLASASTSTVSAASEFTLLIDVSDGLSFNISSTTDPSSYWLKSGQSSGTFRNKAETLSVADKSLLLFNTSTSKGRDIIGSYVRTRVIWTGNTATNPPKESFFETNFRVYDSLGPNYDALGVVFEQRWPTGANDTSNGDTASVLSSFPSFEIPDSPTNPEIGLLQWTSPFSQSYVLQPWAMSAPHWNKLQIQNGTAAGPIALFKNGNPFKVGDNRASMLSSFNSFMDTSPQQVDNELRYGVMGTMKYIPSDYAADTFLYLAPTPLTETVTAWGDVLLRFYGKSKEATYAEDQFTTNYIGYATDNGAFY